MIIFGIALTFTKILPYNKFKEYAPVHGHIIFQSLPYNDLVMAIEGVSQSKYSHCGIVCQKNGAWYVLEAIGPVKYTPLYEWVQRGREQHFWIYEFNDKQIDVDGLILEAEKFLDKPYDVQYDLDDKKIYCSELIYKAYKGLRDQELGKLVKLGDMPWEEYTKTIQKYEQGPPPLERLMITPVNLSKASQLTIKHVSE